MKFKNGEVIGDFGTHEVTVHTLKDITNFVITQKGFIDKSMMITAYPGINRVDIQTFETGRKINEDNSKQFNTRKVRKEIVDAVMEEALDLIKPQTILVTGCSAKKKEGIHPAGKLYESTRISFSKRISKEKETPLFIVSAKYGLIGEKELIPSYDQLMNDDRADELVDTVVDQIVRNKIESIVFFSAGVNKSYQKLLTLAAEKANISIKMIGSGCMQGAKELPSLLDEANNEQNFQKGVLM